MTVDDDERESSGDLSLAECRSDDDERDIEVRGQSLSGKDWKRSGFRRTDNLKCGYKSNFTYVSCYVSPTLSVQLQLYI